MKMDLRTGTGISMMRLVRRTMFATGALLLGWCVFVIVDARLFQVRENRLLQQLLDQRRPASSELSSPVPEREAPSPRQADSGGVTRRPRVDTKMSGRDLIGRIEVPRIGLSAVVIEGSDDRALRRAVGHVPGTALPGHTGNTAMTGHRDTFFRPLRNIQRDDLIRLTTLQGVYTYRVVSMSVVGPDNIDVLRSDREEALTLITCYPFNFFGAAPRRFIVYAQRLFGET
jgi:sortase A